MIELFENKQKFTEIRSSKGNQLKWERNNIWYKADYIGYEGLAESVISKLLNYSSLNKKEYVSYETIEISYKNQVFNGAESINFLTGSWQIITLERLFKTFYGKSLHEALWNIHDSKERLKFLVDEVEKITGLSNFGVYMNKLLTIDALFLNEDRHTHNIAVLMNENNEFEYCPIFDNGAGLLSDINIEYPLNGDIYKEIDSVKSKTVSLNFEEQLNVSEILYGENIKFNFTKNDVEEILSLYNGKESIYSSEIRDRVKTIIFEQMRKYPYLFE